MASFGLYFGVTWGTFWGALFGYVSRGGTVGPGALRATVYAIVVLAGMLVHSAARVGVRRVRSHREATHG